MAKPGLSRGSISDRRFIEDAANNYIVEAFVDVSAVAPGSGLPAATNEQQYIVDAGSGSELGGWGTITGLTDKCIIKYNAIAAEWQVVFAPVAAEQGATAYDKDSDTIFSFDGTDWNIASGAGGGVKNFAQTMASGYKVGDWTTGNNATFGTAGSFAGSLDVETASPLDGKKSFKYTAAAGSQNDWAYFTVDISEYARGGAIAYTFDYTWDGEDDDIEIEIWDPTITNEYSNELNVLKDTTNDYKLSRNSRTIYAHPDTESQVIVGFHVKGAVSGGEELIFDNLKVTDDIGIIGSGSGRLEQEVKSINLNNTILDNNGEYRFTVANIETIGDDILAINDDTGNTRTQFIAQIDCTANVSWTNGPNSSGHHTLIYKNGSIISRGSTNSSSTFLSSSSANFKLNKGDFISLGATAGSPSNGDAYTFSIVATAEEEGLRNLTVPNGEKLKDNFAIKVPAITVNGTYDRATLLGLGLIDPYELVTAVSRGGAGGYTVAFRPIFSTPPICIAVANTVSTKIATAYNESTNSCEVLFEDTTSGVNFDGEFSLLISRPTTTPDIVGVPVSIQGQTHEQDSYLSVTGHNGYGSTATRIPRFATIRAQRGDAFTYLDDATDSSRIVINTSGVYALSISRGSDGGGGGNVGFSVNADAFVTTDVEALGEEYRLTHANTPGGNSVPSATWVGYLNAGDVIRPHTDFQVPQNFTYSYLSVAKIGTQPLLDGGLVESPGNSFVLQNRGTGAAGYGSTYTNVLRYTNTLENGLVASGDILYTDSVTEGMSITILEDGIYAMSATNPYTDASVGSVAISRNADNFTSGPINWSDRTPVIADQHANGATDVYSECSATRRLYKGDIIRVHTGNATGNTSRMDKFLFTITKLGQTVKYSSRVYKEDPIAWQKKVQGNGTNTVGLLNNLQFNNLEVGKAYRITLYHQAIWNGTTTATNQVSCYNNSTGTGSRLFRSILGGQHNNNNIIGTSTYEVFTATDSTVTFRLDNATVSNFQAESYVILEELPFHTQTSKWT